MTVLYITNENKLDIETAYKRFKTFCDQPEDLILKYDLNPAKDFLESQIIDEKRQKHIDFIIVNWQFPNSNAKYLLDWIRNSEASYSTNNFNFRAVPILLIEDDFEQSSAISEGFNAVIQGFPEEYWRTNSAIKSVIKYWRSKLADDLDMIGLDPKTQNSYDGHRHRKSFISYYKLNILTRTFVDNHSKKLNYIWALNDYNDLERSNDILSSMIDKSLNDPRRIPEKQYHELFKEYPTIIKGEQFLSGRIKEELIYEPHLYKNGTRKYDEPDFLNKPYDYSLRTAGALEIKLPHQKMIAAERKHFILRQRKALNKLNDIMII